MVAPARTPEAVARHFIASLADDDLASARDLLAAGATAWLASAPPGATPGRHAGRSFPATRWLDLLQVVLDQVDGRLELLVHDVIADDRRAVLEVESHGPLADGRTYTMRYCFWFEVDDGRIAALRQYFDTDHGRQFFLRIDDEVPSTATR